MPTIRPKKPEPIRRHKASDRSAATIAAVVQLEQLTILTEGEAALVLGVSPATLATWRCRGQGPRFARHGRFVRYRRADLDKWLTANLSGSR